MDRLLLLRLDGKRIVAILTFLIAALFWVYTAPGYAADDWFDWDEDLLFGGSEPVLIEEEPVEAGVDPAQALLMRDLVEIGGAFSLSADSAWTWDAANSGFNLADAKHDTGYQLGGTLYVDVRPNTDWRFFGKGRFSAAKDAEPTGKLTELFADVSIGDLVFLRAGKQTVRWGVGYFFSPADIINIGRIDPEDPQADREGPIALKAHVPRGSNNYYMHAIVDPATSPATLAWAPKAEWVAGKTEWGLGAYVRHDRAPRGMVTFSSSLGKVSVFGEGVISYGSDKRFVQENVSLPLGVEVIRKQSELFAHGTVGARFSYNDPDGRFSVSWAGQYYYNGEGYSKDFLRKHQTALAILLATDELSLFDLQNAGRHYVAVSLNWSKALGSRLSPGLFWLGNLEDGSGMVTTSMGLDLWPKISTSVGLTHTYGDPGSEYAAMGNFSTLFVRVGYSGSF